MVISNQGREDSLGNMRVNRTGLSLHPGHPPTLYYQVLTIAMELLSVSLADSTSGCSDLDSASMDMLALHRFVVHGSPQEHMVNSMQLFLYCKG